MKITQSQKAKIDAQMAIWEASIQQKEKALKEEALKKQPQKANQSTPEPEFKPFPDGEWGAEETADSSSGGSSSDEVVVSDLSPLEQELTALKAIKTEVENNLKKIYKLDEVNQSLERLFAYVAQEKIGCGKERFSFLPKYNEAASEKNRTTLSDLTYLNYVVVPLSNVIASINLFEQGQHELKDENAFLEIDTGFKKLNTTLQQVTNDLSKEALFRKNVDKIIDALTEMENWYLVKSKLPKLLTTKPATKEIQEQYKELNLDRIEFIRCLSDLCNIPLGACNEKVEEKLAVIKRFSEAFFPKYFKIKNGKGDKKKLQQRLLATIALQNTIASMSSNFQSAIAKHDKGVSDKLIQSGAQDIAQARQALDERNKLQEQIAALQLQRNQLEQSAQETQIAFQTQSRQLKEVSDQLAVTSQAAGQKETALSKSEAKLNALQQELDKLQRDLALVTEENNRLKLQLQVQPKVIEVPAPVLPVDPNLKAIDDTFNALFSILNDLEADKPGFLNSQSKQNALVAAAELKAEIKKEYELFPDKDNWHKSPAQQSVQAIDTMVADYNNAECPKDKMAAVTACQQSISKNHSIAHKFGKFIAIVCGAIIGGLIGAALGLGATAALGGMDLGASAVVGLIGGAVVGSAVGAKVAHSWAKAKHDQAKRPVAEDQLLDNLQQASKRPRTIIRSGSIQ